MGILIATDGFNSKVLGIVPKHQFFKVYPHLRDSYRKWAEESRKGHANPCFGRDPEAGLSGWKFYAKPHLRPDSDLVEDADGFTIIPKER